MSIHVKTAGGWVPIVPGGSGLEGIPGWAEISAVTGNPKRYDYTADGVEWAAFEWTADGSVTTSGGLVDCLVVAGGASGGAGAWSGGGAFITGIQSFAAGALTVGVGTGAPAPGVNGGWSQLGDFKPAGPTTTSTDAGQYIGYPGDNPAAGFNSSITGVSHTYSRSNRPDIRANSGDGSNGGPGAAGTVIIRTPASNVTATSGWVTRITHYASVTDGVVTDTHVGYEYPDGTVTPLPSGEWVECDASVSDGWLLVDGEWLPPGGVSTMPSDPDDDI